MKFLIVMLVLVAIATGAFSMNATYGNVNYYNAILSKERIVSYPLNGQFVSREVNFPKNGQINNRIISGIRVTDHFTNKTGATSTLWSGGPGFKFATLNLKSQMGKGINTTVEIYAN